MMTTAQSLAVIQAHFKALNWGDSHDMEGLVAADFVWRNRSTEQTFFGPDGYQAYLSGWRAAFPDFWVEISHLAASTQSVVCEYTLRGMHNGTLRLPGSFVFATRRQIDLPVCETFRIVNGRLSQANTYFDLTTLLQQIGLLLKPGTDRSFHDVLLSPITYQN